MIEVAEALAHGDRIVSPTDRPAAPAVAVSESAREPAAGKRFAMSGKHQHGAGFANLCRLMTSSVPASQVLQATKASSRGNSPSLIMAQKLLHYDVIERLGEGARSVIYAVSDPNTKQLYALKHVVRTDQKDLRFVEQMEAEFEISRQFTHPNLRRTYDLKIHKTMLVKVTEAFLLMELVDGKALDVRPPKTMLETIDTFVQVAQGLQAMHTLGYVHCDIKPNNILRSDT